MRNIEIKAKVENIAALEDKVKEISDGPKVVIKQDDIFFNANPNKSGRLKLRNFEDGTGQLIHYERPDISGPKLSSYSIVNLDGKTRDDMRDLLTKALGVLGTVQKTRHLYMSGQTRIHVDRVHNLGDFLEFEVVLRDDQDYKTGNNIADALMKQLDISGTDLICGAYIDLM